MLVQNNTTMHYLQRIKHQRHLPCLTFWGLPLSVHLLANNLTEVWRVKDTRLTWSLTLKFSSRNWNWKSVSEHHVLNEWPPPPRHRQCKSAWRISGAGFLRLSGIGTGSLGRLLSLRVMIGFTSIESMFGTNITNTDPTMTFKQFKTFFLRCAIVGKHTTRTTAKRGKRLNYLVWNCFFNLCSDNLILKL